MDGGSKKALLEKIPCLKKRAHMKKGKRWGQKMGRKQDYVKPGVHLFNKIS